MERPTPPSKTFAQALKETFDKAANQAGQQHNRKRSTRKRLIPVGSGPWLWNPSYLREARAMIVTGGALVLLGLIGYGLATEGHDTHWLLCYLGGLVGSLGMLARVAAWMHGRLQICPQCYANMQRGLTTCLHCGFTEESSYA
jgi:hypothetical protein